MINLALQACGIKARPVQMARISVFLLSLLHSLP